MIRTYVWAISSVRCIDTVRRELCLTAGYTILFDRVTEIKSDIFKEYEDSFS